MTTVARIVPLPTAATAADSVPVDLQTLTQYELQVIFYAANYRRTYDEYLCGPNLVALAEAVITVTASLGLELIRQAAACLEYAELAGDLSLRDRMCPDHPRRSEAGSLARALRRALRGNTSALTWAAVAARWQAAICGSRAEAVAA